MKISIANTHPPAHELVHVLNDAFGSRYCFRLFGFGNKKTIMARKSALVGLQLSLADDEVSFQRTAPTIASSALSSMMLTELAALLILPLVIIYKGFTKDPYKEMATEIGSFLRPGIRWQADSVHKFTTLPNKRSI